MRILPSQLGTLRVQRALKGAVSDFNSKLHLLAGLFHVVERQAHAAAVGSVDSRRDRLVRSIPEMEDHSERAARRLEGTFPISLQFLRHRRAGRDQFHSRLARTLEVD